MLNNTAQDAFRVPATYYDERGLFTVFDEGGAVEMLHTAYAFDQLAKIDLDLGE